MFNLFRKNKASINSISIPDFGWSLEHEDSAIKHWTNQSQTMALSVNFFNVVPDLPSIQNIEMVRNFYRGQVIDANGGLVQVDFIEIGGIKAIKTIVKIPQEGKGIMYLTSITIPFKSCSYVIKIQAPEVGMTGIRESVISAKLMGDGTVSLDDAGLVGWADDPYLENVTNGTPMNLSEQPEYDKDFPEHALSVSRKIISQIETEVVLTEELKEIKKYTR